MALVDARLFLCMFGSTNAPVRGDTVLQLKQKAEQGNHIRQGIMRLYHVLDFDLAAILGFKESHRVAHTPGKKVTEVRCISTAPVAGLLRGQTSLLGLTLGYVPRHAPSLLANTTQK